MCRSNRGAPFLEADFIVIGQYYFSIVSGTKDDALLGLHLHQITSDVLDLIHKGQFGLIVL